MSENGFPSNIDIVDYDFNNVSKTGGDIRIQGKNIIFVDGSQINATNNVNTSGGLVIINAIESVQIIGSSTPIDLPDGSTLSLSSHISFGTTNNGRGGNIEIHTKKLVLQDRGSILVNALRLILNDVNQPIGEGQAGTITINASESTELVGETTTISSSTSTKGDAGNIEINTDRLIVRDGATIQANTSPKSEEFPESEGDGGSIIVNAREIDLLDGGSLIVNSQATGRGGDIEIDTEVLNLNNQGKITADSFGNDGGNISLNVSNILELRQQSTISTNAGETIGGGDGGNIDIDARFIFAVPEENSDISANAFEGNGGNITIDSESLFGIAYRNEDTPLSDITAFSRNKFALDGTVTINSPDVDPSQYLNETAVETKVPQLLRGCQAGRDSDSRFVNIGKGGLPIDPYDLVSSRELVEDLRLPQHWSQSIESNSNNQEIIEATGIQRDDRGDTILVGKDSDRITCGQ
jgi:large exoprotein involved in heme utilization and adhesion